MAQHSSLFSTPRTVFWPSEFADLVNMLKGQDAHGSPSHPPMYSFNTNPIVLGAILGIAHQREREVGPQRLEIGTDVFERQRFGNSSLASFLLLIPLIGTGDLDLLRPEREEELIRRFERYAAGGLEYLRGAMSRSSDSTGQAVLKAEIQRALTAQPRIARMLTEATEEEDLQI
jgi:hypothetical protein